MEVGRPVRWLLQGPRQERLVAWQSWGMGSRGRGAKWLEPKHLLVACVRCEKKHWGDPSSRPGRVELPFAAGQG